MEVNFSFAILLIKKKFNPNTQISPGLLWIHKSGCSTQLKEFPQFYSPIIPFDITDSVSYSQNTFLELTVKNN